MKKRIIFLLLLLLNAGLISASINIEHKCHAKNCLEGTGIDYSFIIYNNLDKKIDVKDVFLKEKDTGNIFEYYEISERILPGEHKEFNFTSEIKAPDTGYTFYFYSCFTTAISNQSHITEAGIVCGEVVRSFTTIPLSKIDCNTNNECLSGEYCNTDLLKCKPLKCKSFKIINNHKCISLGIYAGAFLIIAISLTLILIKHKRKSKQRSENDNAEEESADNREREHKEKEHEQNEEEQH